MYNSIAFIAWITASISIIAAIISVIKQDFKKTVRIIAPIYTATLAVLLTINSIRLGVIALISLHDVFLFLSLVSSLILVIKKRESAVYLLLSFASWLTISLAVSPLAPAPVSREPVLTNTWLILHVLTSTAGEALLYSGTFLLIAWIAGKKEENFLLADNLIYSGYLLFTAGALLFGAVWAFFAWGSFWSWDPKETCSLITWLGFTSYVHLGKNNKKKTWALAIVFISAALMLFTLLGVPYLLGGQHAYN